MIARCIHHVTGAVLAALLLLGLAAAARAQTPLSQKAADAAEITAVAQQEGHVRVIVMFDSPVPPGELKPDAASVANARARVAAAQDGIIASHFGSATSPSQGQGFARGLARFPITPGFAVNVTLPELQALAADARVMRIEYDRAVPPSLIDSVPLIGMTTAYTLNATGAGQAVAVLDTGVKSNHEFLIGKVVAEACFSNAGGFGGQVTLCPGGGSSQTGAGAANADTAACINGAQNICNHGTHVAGIAAGLNSNQQGGEPPNGVAKDGKIFALQIFTRFNSAATCSPNPAPCVLTFTSDQILGLDHVFANINLGGGTVVASANMSLGGGLFSGTCDGASQKPAIDNLRAAGVLTAIASGNNGSTSQISSPGCISTAVAVGSTTKSDQVSSFSNMSAVVDLLAPGSSIQSSIPVVPASNTTTYAFFNGTSMATPHVAGAIAAVRSACPSATADAIENALKSTGTPIADTRPGGSQTKPRIRVDLAVQSLNCNVPANDNFANAIIIQGGQTLSGTNVNATKQSGEPNHAGNAGGKSVWWKFTAAASGQVKISTANSSFDTLLAVYTGSSVNALTLVVSNNDHGGAATSFVSFSAVAGTTYSIAVDGFNGASGNVSLSMTAPNADLTCGLQAQFADFNGDGKTDILTRHTDGKVGIYLMNGFQSTANQIVATVDPQWKVVGSGDFNGDGKADFLMRHTDGSLAIYLMNGLQVLASQVIGTISNEWAVVGVGDFNGDGKADFMVRHTVDGAFAIYLMNGFVNTDAQVIGTVDLQWKVVGIGDFNGDERADFVLRHTDGSIAIYLMNGFQILAAEVAAVVGNEWTFSGVADFDANGKSDFVNRRTDGAFAIFLMNGTQFASATIIGFVGNEWALLGVGDFNGDGKADFINRRSTDASIAIFLMNVLEFSDAQIIVLPGC